MKMIYVSSKGNDLNSGEKNAPFKSILKARDEARKYDNATVVIESGRYFINETIELDERDSNTIYKADGDVFFDGGIIINNDDVKDYKDGIKVVDLKPFNIKIGEYGNRGFKRAYINAPNELFVNGESYSVARYPKNDKIAYKEGEVVDSGSNPRHGDYSNRPAIIKLDKDLLEKWSDAKDAYIGGFPRHSWADDCIKIAKIDLESSTITTTEPAMYSFRVTKCSSWYIVNLLEELTDEGEYYIDRESEKLYFIPKGDIKDAFIQLSVLDKVMIAVENAQNVTIDGITFENSRNSGIYIEGGDSVNITNCIFRNLGIMAVQVGQGAETQPHGFHDGTGKRAKGISVPKPISRELGSWNEYLYEFAAWDNNGGINHMIQSCKIYNMGAGGVMLSGGNRKSLVPGNNTVHNCEFYDINRLDKTYKSAVNIMGVGNTVSHCEIYNLSGIAIYLHGNDHVIEFNKIHDVCSMVSDSGAIYMGRDMSEVGNVFRNNYIYNLQDTYETGCGVCAIYFDDSAIFNAVYDNFFYNIHGGRFCVINYNRGGLFSFHNNFIIDCVPGVHCDNKSNSYIVMHSDDPSMQRVKTKDINDMRGVDVTSPIYKEKYPYLYDVYKNDARPESMCYNNQILYHKYDIFVDGENADFTQLESFGKNPGTYDCMRRTDVIMGYENDHVAPHRVEFRKIGIIKEKTE